MSFGFKVDQNKDDGILVQFIGEIDEMADFNKIDLPDVNRITLDLKGIRLLNSVGLRSWVIWVKSLKQDVIVLRHCPAVAVHQMNILDGFLPLKSVVESFEVPYHCEECENDTSIWAKRGTHFYERTADKPDWQKFDEAIECQNCGAKAKLDVIPAKYFHFLKSRK